MNEDASPRSFAQGRSESPSVGLALGYPLARIDLEGAARKLLAECTADRRESPYFVVTLNPELVVRAHADPVLRRAVAAADLIVADGVGVVWAARRAGVSLPGRVPGVDLAFRLMELGSESLRVYFLGGKPGVAERAALAARKRWGVRVAGHHHGYFSPEDEERVVAEVGRSKPHLLLAGLGEAQELFLARHRDGLEARAMIGVGGTLDVLAGEAVRTPEWTRRSNLEWAWRVGLDRRRWHRIPRLIAFARLVLRQGGKGR